MKENHKELALAAERFTIEVIDEERGIVQAVPTTSTTEAARLTATTSDGTLQSGAVAGPRTNQLAGVQTALSVVEHWMRAQPSNDKFYFPEAELDEQELTKLFLWARPRRLMLIVSGKALTLSPLDIHVAAVQWKPPGWVDENESEEPEEQPFPTDQP